MLDFEINVSPDRKTASIKLELGNQIAEALTPRDIETLIDKLSEVRQMMVPAVRQSEPLSPEGLPTVESFSPDMRLMEASLSIGERVLLAIAYHGLGWRTISLHPHEAQNLGRRLMTLSAQGQQS